MSAVPVPETSIERFRKVVAAACAQLEARRQEVNDLNVFPVADGDTGDNMTQTLRAVMQELDRLNGQAVDDIGRDEVVRAVARAALLGARGNSGVILSQVVRGAAEELSSRPGELVDPVLVSAALARAADAAYSSVRDPAEGTMRVPGPEVPGQVPEGDVEADVEPDPEQNSEKRAPKTRQSAPARLKGALSTRT